MSCFVCEIDDHRILYRVCRCSTFAHRDCIETVIQRVASHNTNCPVCITPYDVASHDVRVFRLIGPYAQETVLFYLGTVFLTMSAVWLYVWSRMRGEDHCAVILVMSLLCVLCLLLSLTFHASNGRLCCIQRVKSISKVTLNVPSVQQL